MEEFKKLTDREHMLTRPSMYIGKTVPETVNRFIHGTRTDVTVSPGLMKIVNELVDNSIDEFIRSDGKFATKITITCTDSTITVEDNGRGIPVERYQGEWRPQVAWTEAKAGTSFSADRVGPGANGVGSVVANVFSKTFCGVTRDGNLECTVSCSSNMETIKTTVGKSSKRGTCVTIVPDFERFGVSNFTDDHIKLLGDRIALLAITYPEINFIFNGTSIKYKNAVTYFEEYGETFLNFFGKNFVAAVFPSDSDEYIQRSSIDGLDMVLGGTHEQVISRELSYALRDIIKKKHKLELSPAEIKRGLKFVFIGRSFPNMEFDSQTKERLTNSEKTVKDWLGDIDYQKLAKKIFDIKEIIDPIIQAKLAKQLAAEQRAVTLALKKQAKKHVDKHLEAKSKNPDDKILFLCEGDCLDESTRILRVDENGDIESTKLVDISVGDIVMTHNHKLRPVIGITKKIKDGVKIKTTVGEIVCSKEHRFYLYNTMSNNFEFVAVTDIDMKIHKFVRSKFIDISDGFTKIKSINKSSDEKYQYELVFDDLAGYILKSTAGHKFVVFDTETNGIIIKQCSELVDGDYISFAK